MSLDPVTVGIATGRLHSILDEQQATLVRTAFSTIVRESEDLACGVFDTAGNMIGQSSSGTPGHINAMATGVKHFVAAFRPGTLEPGDILLTNDPWMTAGQINDLTVCSPVFREGRHLAFFASTCHAPDIGGRLLSAEANDVYEEGLRLPILKLARAGVMNEDVLNIIRANVRTPDETVGDLYAQIAANDVGARSLLRMLADLELEDLDTVGDEICRRSEEAMRAAIRELPDGRYEAEAYSDGYRERVKLKVAVTIDGDELDIDFAGSSPQSPHGINVVLNYTHAYASFAMKAAVAPEVPHNAGSFAPVHVRAPEGSILNCRPPAPVASRHLIGHFLPGLILAAMEPVLGERRPAGGSDSLWLSVWSGEGVHLTLFSSGGSGARHGADGHNATGFPSAVAYVPTEILEQGRPLIQRMRALRPDSGGAGTWRGGLGQTSVISSRGARVTVLADRTDVPAPGAAGGEPGAPGALNIPGKRLVTPEGDVRFDLPGGGGYGPPSERDPQAVLRDVVSGYVSAEAAEAHYGVVVERIRDGLVAMPEDFEIQEGQ